MFVIAGVSGNTGSVVATELLARGEKVRVVVRDAKKGEPWKAKGAEVAIASLDDEAALTKALAGATGAYLLSPPDLASKDPIEEKRRFFETLAGAVEKAKVPHVVFLSSIGAQHANGTGMIRTVHLGEERLAKTSAKLTFIRAAYFLDNWRAVLGAAEHGKLPTFIPADLAIPMVATKDIGLVSAAALIEGAPAEKTRVIELAGPVDYDAKAIAAAVAGIVGKPVAADVAPVEAVVPTYQSFGMSQEVATLFREMYEGIANGTVAFEGKGARRVRGKVDAATALRPS